jgi:cytochrome b involved in lipid metabolism
MAPIKMYTAEELAVHNKPDDLYIAVDGKGMCCPVYAVPV